MHFCKKIIIIILYFVLIITDSSVFAEINKKNIVVFATGGTIAGSGKKGSSASYKPAVFPVNELLSSVPEIQKIADVTGKQIVQVGSQAMTSEIWMQLARSVDDAVNNNEVDGIVITHGTDTMEETAYFLNLVINTSKPVVFVGSMRPPTSISADGPLNFYNAVFLAAHKKASGKGVMLLLNNEIHSAREATKANTTQVNAFKSINNGMMGYIIEDDIYFYKQPAKKHTYKSEFSINDISSLPKVDIVYGYSNCGREAVDAFVDNGSKGVVIAGTGNGNIHPAAMQGLVDAEKNGVVVVRSSRCGSGVVINESDNDNKSKFIYSNTLNPQKARVLIMTALTKTNNLEQIQKVFDTY
ncbi:MAG: asparaginase [bacterium]|nr:asparaginase [bacterium]